MHQFSVTFVLPVLFYAFCIVIKVNGSSKNVPSSSGASVVNSKSLGKQVNGIEVPDSYNSRIVLGRFYDVDASGLESPEIQDVAQFATNQVASEVNSPKEFNLLKVVACQKQIVEGVNYNLGIIVVPNHCDRKKSRHNHDTDTPCPSYPCDKALYCEARVYAVPWRQQQILVNLACKPDHSTCGKDSKE